jgi:hypothetical protein
MASPTGLEPGLLARNPEQLLINSSQRRVCMVCAEHARVGLPAGAHSLMRPPRGYTFYGGMDIALRVRQNATPAVDLSSWNSGGRS